MRLLQEHKGTRIMITHREGLLRYVDRVVEVKKTEH